MKISQSCIYSDHFVFVCEILALLSRSKSDFTIYCTCAELSSDFGVMAVVVVLPAP